MGDSQIPRRIPVKPACDRLGLAKGDKRLFYHSPSGTALDGLGSIEAAGWTVADVADAERAKECLHAGAFDVGLYAFPEKNFTGMEKEIDGLLSADPMVPWVALFPGLANMDLFAHLVTRYFFDYHTLPLDAERLLITLGHACGMSRLHKRLLAGTPHGLQVGEIVGDSVPMQDLVRSVRKVANVDAPVLIFGESGTGKELVAHAIHRRSHRAEGPFVAVNCGALPPSLIQSELFGHEKGAFTGADHRRIGRFEAADRGTLFLDEIDDLPLDLQVNLLRFLEEKTVERVGSTRPIPIDARVIAASHVNLATAVARGEFREDLYFRINVIQLRMPRLAERDGDIELLARHFFQRFSKEKGLRLKGFSEDALNAMADYNWPGNVRELINRVRRAVVMAEGQLITTADLGLGPPAGEEGLKTLAQARSEAEERAIRAALARNADSATRAAHSLEISRASLYRLMAKYRIHP